MLNIPNFNRVQAFPKGMPQQNTQNTPYHDNKSSSSVQRNVSGMDKSGAAQSAGSSTNEPLLQTSWLYVNDVHGKMTNMERIYNITREFDEIPAYVYSANFFTKPDTKNGAPASEQISKFKVASGDIILGANYTHNQVANKFLDWSGFIASTIGNHELDVARPDDLSKLLSDSKCKMLSVNIDINPNSPLAKQISKSMVFEKDGEKYGFIGISPSDMLQRVKQNETLSQIEIKDLPETIKLLKEEIQKLKSQGINKIIVLSHSGNKNDKLIAQTVDDIDIIFGAHSHELIPGITEGENLFYSKKGEPVVITQAGKDGENIGILNVNFDKNGVIKKVQNNIINVREFNRPLFIKDSVEQILGKPEIIGKVKYAAPAPKQRLLENNPHANIIADAMKEELGTDISILNAGNIRGSFSQGPVDTRLISDITPFEDKMMIINLTEKQIVDSVKVGLKSFNSSNSKPGILLVSGLKYKADKKGNLLDMEYLDKNGGSHKIDVNKPDTTKKYTVACDDFFATGGDGYLQSNSDPDFVVKKFDIDKNKLACDYIKKLPQPMEIRPDDRIVIVD